MPGKTMRARLAPMLAAGLLALGAAHGTHDGRQEVNAWAQDQVTHAGYESPGHLSGNAPDPPGTFTLVKTSANGAALGFEISALAKHLGETLEEGSAPTSEETIEISHEVVCFVVFWLLEDRIDPGDPLELGRTIDAYLVANDLPPLDYPRANSDLEKIYLYVERALSSDELAREVAEAACDAA